MLIDPDFTRNNQVIGKHLHSEVQRYDYVWGQGKTAEAAENEEARTAFAAKSNIVYFRIYLCLCRYFQSRQIIL
jgi:hypothetical protein